jgi:hypothetical protein
MSIDKDVGADKHGLIDLTPEEARRKRHHFLAITAENTRPGNGTNDEIDSADSTMATLILPGG